MYVKELFSLLPLLSHPYHNDKKYIVIKNKKKKKCPIPVRW